MITKFIRNQLYELLLYIATFIPSLTPYINTFYYNTYFLETILTISPSVQAFNFDCLFKQYVSEWSISIEHTVNAMNDLKSLIEKEGFKVNFPIEVRFVKGDDILLSPCYNMDSCFIGVIMYK